jgi:hypothetical protein
MYVGLLLEQVNPYLQMSVRMLILFYFVLYKPLDKLETNDVDWRRIVLMVVQNEWKLCKDLDKLVCKDLEKESSLSLLFCLKKS